MSRSDPSEDGIAPDAGELPAWLRTPLSPAQARSGRSPRGRGEGTANRLVEAGRAAFWEHGYDATRVDDIVGLAGTSHGTFYRYFRNKEDLLHTLAIGCVDDMRELSRQLDRLAPPPSLEALSDWVGRFVESYARNGPVLRTWLERRDTDPLMQSLASEVLGEFSESLGRLVDPDIDAAIGPGLMRLGLLTMLERFTSYHQTSDGLLTKDALVATQARLFAAVMNPAGIAGP